MGPFGGESSPCLAKFMKEFRLWRKFLIFLVVHLTHLHLASSLFQTLINFCPNFYCCPFQLYEKLTILPQHLEKLNIYFIDINATFFSIWLLGYSQNFTLLQINKGSPEPTFGISPFTNDLNVYGVN